MKKILIGLIAGMVLGAFVVFLYIPTFEKRAYDRGNEKGLNEGNAKGIAIGITQGIAQIQNEQKRSADSVSAVRFAQQQAQKLRASKLSRKVVKPTENFQVIKDDEGYHVGAKIE